MAKGTSQARERNAKAPNRGAKASIGKGAKANANKRSETGSKGKAPVKAVAGEKSVRYAVVGLGHIAQAAVLPAFRNAKRNSVLAALVSDDAEKQRKLGAKYGIAPERVYPYAEYDKCLKSGEIDAVYIALPNSMHEEYATRAARAGIHVLCEKPLSSTVAGCEAIVRACERADVRLMTAYRLHFNAANLMAAEMCRSKKIGEPRIFNSLFTMQVQSEENIRLRKDLGGGPLPDIGIYCINAARSLFRDEPDEVLAWTVNSGDRRFREVHETVSAVMRYPGERIAAFTCSFGAADVASYQIIGTKGDVLLDPAYEYASGLRSVITIDGKKKETKFPKSDQFGAELLYFSDCVLQQRKPEPSGEEGTADVRIIEALHRSIRTRHAVSVRSGSQEMVRETLPTIEQKQTLPAIGKVELVHAASASG